VSAPHGDQPIVTSGLPLEESRAAVIMVHGRGAGPANILELVPALARPAFTYVAPAAANRSWYPLSFLAPTEQNEPYLSSAIARVHTVVGQVRDAGVPVERIVLLGFSQGACLASEFVYRYPARYGGLIAFSGGLIGPPGTNWSPTSGSLDGMSAFFGCSDVDAHVPKTRVDESVQVLTLMGASVTERIYPGMGHLVSDDENVYAQAILDSVTSGVRSRAPEGRSAKP
jgi:phospholipase/carboxylesterase